MNKAEQVKKENTNSHPVASIKMLRFKRTGKLAFSIIAQLAILSCVIVATLFIYASNTSSLRAQDESIAHLDSQIASEEAKAKELANEAEYGSSEQYIEKIAREVLGYIKNDEIIFRINEN